MSDAKSKPSFLRLKHVQNRIPLCRSGIADLIAAGDFPASIALGKRARGWVEAEIDAWIEARIARRPQSTEPITTNR